VNLLLAGRSIRNVSRPQTRSIAMIAVQQKQSLPFLVMEENHLDAKKARIAVMKLMARMLQPCPDGGWERAVVKVQKDNVEVVSLTFAEMVEQAQRTGVVQPFQRLYDSQHPQFAGLPQEAASTPDFRVRITTRSGEQEVEIPGPCRVSIPANDLKDDILYYREMCCLHSSEHDFELLARSFRNYLSACVSIVEIHLWSAKSGGSFKDLEEQACAHLTSIHSRLYDELGSEPSWQAFKHIYEKRREIVHGTPGSVYSLPEIHECLNKVRGIGRLLHLMQPESSNELGYSIQLRTAPLVHYQKIGFSVDGEEVIGVEEGERW
jgi:hypothetical protein